jgi:hypothetical protein
MSAKHIAAAFDQGKVPTIVVVNMAKTPLGFNLDAFISAANKYVKNYILPVWGTDANLIKGSTVPKGSWVLVFLDTADVAGALAYHDLTPDGFPLMKVFVKTTLDDGASVSVSATHELVETLVDPAINMGCTSADGRSWLAYETADPVEETDFLIDGIRCSNFVYPSYFETYRKPKSTKFDQLNFVTKPLQLLKGGYQSIFKNGKWSEVSGSAAKKKRFAKEDRRGHRSESRSKKLRKASSRHPLFKSN